MLFSLPSFWIGTLAMVFLCGGDFFYVFPPGGLTSVNYSPAWSVLAASPGSRLALCLPVAMLSYAGFASLSRFMRSSMLENMRQDFVQTARAKGLSERVVIYKHVLRNSLIPIVTIMASILPGLISGSVIIETIFSIPGLGQLGYEAVLARDYPIIMAVFTISSLLTLLSILLSDLLLTSSIPALPLADVVPTMPPAQSYGRRVWRHFKRKPWRSGAVGFPGASPHGAASRFSRQR